MKSQIMDKEHRKMYTQRYIKSLYDKFGNIQDIPLVTMKFRIPLSCINEVSMLQEKHKKIRCA